MNAPSRRRRLLYSPQQHHLQSFGVSVSGTKMRGFRKNVSSGLDLFLGEQTGMCECEAAYSETGRNPSGPARRATRSSQMIYDLRSTLRMRTSTSRPSRRGFIEADGGVRTVAPSGATYYHIIYDRRAPGDTGSGLSAPLRAEGSDRSETAK